MKHLIPLTLILLTANLTRAHISYVARDLGSYDPVVSRTVTLASNSVSSDFGWASGTDANGGDSHRVRAFKFTMVAAGTITIQAQGLSFDRGGILIGALGHPGFSVYRGLAHESPALADHDTSPISTQWNDVTYGAGNWEGSFRALGDWKIGNDDGASFADLSSFTYQGNAADGTNALFGNAPGIFGDGNADGMVVHSLSLDAGAYSIFVGGARYYDLLNTGGSTGAFGFSLTVSTIPEPSSGALLLAGMAVLAFRRRRIKKRFKSDLVEGERGQAGTGLNASLFKLGSWIR